MFAEMAISLKSQPQWIQQGVKLGKAYHYRQKKTAIHNSRANAELALRGRRGHPRVARARCGRGAEHYPNDP